MAGGLRERGELGHDLFGELTGRREHEGDGALGAGVDEAGDEREPEAEGLTGTGGGVASDIATCERVVDDGGLDREGVVLALALQAMDDRVGQTEISEGDRRCIVSVSGDVTRGASSMMVMGELLYVA